MTFCDCSKIQLLLPKTIMIWFANPTLLIQVALFKKATYFMNFLCWPLWGCLRRASGWVYMNTWLGRGRDEKNLFPDVFGMCFGTFSKVVARWPPIAATLPWLKPITKPWDGETPGAWKGGEKSKSSQFVDLNRSPKVEAWNALFAASIINDTLRIF